MLGTLVKNLIAELHWKTISFLIENYDTIILPDFRVSEMVRKKKLSRNTKRLMCMFSFFSFKEKLKDIKNGNPVNGGFFVFKKEFLELIPHDPSVDLEKAPMDKLVEINQLSFFKHTGFWQCMDTYRDYQYLNELWKDKAPWKIW